MEGYFSSVYSLINWTVTKHEEHLQWKLHVWVSLLITWHDVEESVLRIWGDRETAWHGKNKVDLMDYRIKGIIDKRVRILSSC